MQYFKNKNIYIYTVLLVVLILLSGCQKDKNHRLSINKKTKNSDQPKVSQGPIATMNFDEAAIAKDYYKKQERFDMAIKALQRMQSLAVDSQQQAKLLLERADVYFSWCHWEEAGNDYNEFISLYPGNTALRYARYRLIMSYEKLISSFDRDQSQTYVTLKKAILFLQDYGTSGEDNIVVQKVVNHCYDTILFTELYIADYYVDKYFQKGKKASLAAAYERLSNFYKIFLRAQQEFFEKSIEQFSIHIILKNIDELLQADELEDGAEKMSNLISMLKETIIK